MTQDQLEMMFGYISNEIALAALRSSGMSWEVQEKNRNNLKTSLRISVERANKVAAEPEYKIHTKSDSPAPHNADRKFSPLMIEMLMYAYHSGRDLKNFPNLLFPAQQQAYNWFVVNDYFQTLDLEFRVKLTQKGLILVDNILNTSVED